MLSRPIRTVLWWQLIATSALTVLGGVLAGVHGAFSAALGGMVSICAGSASAMVAMGRADSAGGVLITALLAEGTKIGLIVILLIAVLAMYDDVVALAFFGSFVVTAVLFSMAFFVREYK